MAPAPPVACWTKTDKKALFIFFRLLQADMQVQYTTHKTPCLHCLRIDKLLATLHRRPITGDLRFLPYKQWCIQRCDTTIGQPDHLESMPGTFWQ